MSEENNDSGSIAWLVTKCGLMTLLGLALILLVCSFPEEIVSIVAVAVVGVSGFLGTIFGLAGRGLNFVGTTPWLAILVMASIYAWGCCVSAKLNSRKQKCDGYHYLQMTLHKLALLIWLICLIKLTQIDGFGAGLVFLVGGIGCLVHWCISEDSSKVLARRKKLRNLKSARLGKRWS